MVELQLEPLDGALNKDFYVSVRVGEVQKLSRISPGRSYKFPQNAVGDRKFGKIEIFKKVGGASVGIVPDNGMVQEVCVPLGSQDETVKFKVSLIVDGDKKPSSVPVKASPSEDKPGMREVNPKVQQAKAYLEQHNLEMRLSEAMQAVLREKPDDPAAFVAEKLAKSAGMVQKMPQSAPATPAAPSVPAVKVEGSAPPGALKSAAPPQAAPVVTSVLPFAAYYQVNMRAAPSQSLESIYKLFPAYTTRPAPTAPAPPAAPAGGKPQAAEAAPAKALPKVDDCPSQEKESNVPVNERWDAKPSVGTWASHLRGPKLVSGARG